MVLVWRLSWRLVDFTELVVDFWARGVFLSVLLSFFVLFLKVFFLEGFSYLEVLGAEEGGR